GRKAWTKSLGRLSETAAEQAALKLDVANNDLITYLSGLPDAERKYIAANGGYDGLQRNADWYEEHAARIRSIADALDSVPESAYMGAAAHGLSRGDLAEAFMNTRKEAKAFEQRVAMTRKVLRTPVTTGVVSLIPSWLRISRPSAKTIEHTQLYARR